MLILHIIHITVPTSAPHNLTGHAVSSSSIFITWMSPMLENLNGNLRGFEINVTEIESQSTFTLQVKEEKHLISFLHPYYSYMFAIAAVTIGKGPFSSSITVETPEDGKQKLI